MELIEKQMDYLQNSGFNMDSIIGVFDVRALVSPFIKLEDYADLLVLTSPTLDDLCWENEDSFEVNNKETFDGTKLAIVDIRTYCRALKMQSLLYLATLYTDKVYLEEKYKDAFFEFFLLNRENIVQYDRLRVINKVTEKIRSAIDIKSANNLLSFLHKYKDYAEFRDCIQPSSNLIEDPIEIYNQANEIKTEYNENIPLREVRAVSAINQGMKEILKLSLNNTQTISSNEMYKKLTEKEIRALDEINKRIHGEGIVVISSLVAETNISRPVYNILLQKLRESGAAEIVNMGVKGTKIKMLI